MDNIKQKRKGFFISIDGADGTGKQTQAKILAENLTKMGFEVETISFPQYGKKSAGIAEEYLNGKYGGALDVNPYACSIFYAVDRFDAKKQIETWLSEGKIVISDRYVSANMGHQGAKIHKEEDRISFFKWLHNLEYDIFEIPKPDISIILNISREISQNLLNQLEAKKYLINYSKDIHEGDLSHLKKASQIFYEIGKTFDEYIFIDCSPEDKLLPKEEISSLIWNNLKPLLVKENYSPNFLNSNSHPEYEILQVEKIFDNSKIPQRAHASDAGLDIFSVEARTIYPGESAIIRTGIKMAIPEGHVGLVWDKSGIAKAGLSTMGGVIDSGFRGEITINIFNLSRDIYNIEIGQKIAQLLIQKVEFPLILETKLDKNTERGEKGYGSSGLY